MDISTLLASFTTIQPATKNPTIDDQIKVHVATLEAFNSQGQLRSLVDNSTVNPETISQARSLVGQLNRLTVAQKESVLAQLKSMVDAAEGQIMTKLLSASANSGATSITALVEAATHPVQSKPVQSSVSSFPVTGLGDVGSLIGLLGGLFGNVAPQPAPVKSQVVNGVNVTKAREQVAGSNVDFKELRKTFNM